MLLTILSVVLGGLITVCVAMAIEELKRPSFTLEVGRPHDLSWCPARQKSCGRFLNVKVTNTAAAPKWMLPVAATRCRAVISFYDKSRQRAFDRHHQMVGRWDSAPEIVGVPLNLSAPVAVHTAQGLSPVGHAMISTVMPDFAALLNQEITIHQGESELLNIAAQFDDESDCYGWCNDNYEQWDLPRRMMARGEWHIKVQCESMGVRRVRWFKLINYGHRTKLLLEPLEYMDADDAH